MASWTQLKDSRPLEMGCETSWPCVGWCGQDSMRQSTAVAVDHNGSMDLGEIRLPFAVIIFGPFLVG